MLELFITFLVGIVSSILSGMAGGGGGLISAPFFILIGLPPQVAVATTKFGALGLTLGSLAKFRKTEHIRKEYVIYLSILSIVAAVIGSRLLLISSNETIEKLVGVMMLIALPFIFTKNIGLKRSQPSQIKKYIGYILYFVILVLQAAFGAGVGMTLMIVMMGLMGFTALESNATRRIPGFILAITALLIYMLSGVVYYSYGLAILAGMIIGGYIGTHIAIKQGNTFVKVIFGVVVAVLGLNLLLS
ncbi:sulfite exporter TauE/SafE family protein [Candidatus Falkowbacteria bacterium]|nr:sulfite exporter TauE/SafE family protein [Candidatus Falkowbacteria bacterium]